MKLMANYNIIGGDGKEYGPVTEAEIRQWIAEGRLNAASQAKAESDSEWRSLGIFPEFAGAFSAASGPAPIAEDPGVLNEGDYELDVFGSISRGWEIFKNNLGTLVGAGVVYLALLIATYLAVSLVTRLLSGGSDPATLMSPAYQAANLMVQIFLVPLVQGPLVAGFYFLILKVIREQPVGVGDLFAGFQRSFAPSYLCAMLVALVAGLSFLPFNWVCNSKLAPVLEQMQHTQPDQMKDMVRQVFEIFLNSSPIFFLCCLPAIFFAVNWFFALALTADRQLTAGAALKTSWKMVMRHWWQIFGLIVLVGLLNVAGFFMCCVGLLFTIPLGMTATMVAYEVIFTRKKA